MRRRRLLKSELDIWIIASCEATPVRYNCAKLMTCCGLPVQDVDPENRVLMVRDSKFFKTRLVPIGPRLTMVLTDYLSARCQLPSISWLSAIGDHAKTEQIKTSGTSMA
jgi:hypothetical protein